MGTSSISHAMTGRHRRLVVLAVAVTALAVMAGVTLADRRVPAGAVIATGATGEALAAVAHGRRAPLAETAPSSSPPARTPAAADDGEPWFKSAE
jgi:hypothetical protein